MVLVERFDRKLRKPEELEPLADVPLLGTIPYAAFPGEESGPQISEAFQTLRDSLTYFNINRDLTTLVVVSPLKGEGKTTVVANLAVAFARAGKRVNAVICTCVTRSLRPGSASITRRGSARFSMAALELRIALGRRVRWRPAGTAGRLAAQSFGAPRLGAMSSLLGQLADQYELVLIDTAPLLVISDAFALCNRPRA